MVQHTEGKKSDQHPATPAVVSSWFQQLMLIAEQDPRALAQVLCRGVVADPTSTASYLTGRAGDSIRRRFLWPAEALAKSFDQRLVDARDAAPYIAVKDWIERDFASKPASAYRRQFTEPNIDLVLETFFAPLVYEIQLSTALATQLVYHGVPLYELKGGEYVIADEKSDEMAYLRYRGREMEVLDSWDSPPWAEKYHLKVTHLRLYATFFKNYWQQSRDEIQQLRTAFRTAIGLSPNQSDEQPANQPKRSKLFSLITPVLARYYGQNFVETDSSTWPRQKDIVSWLKETEGLSEREAQAIDIVCRPDALRGK